MRTVLVLVAAVAAAVTATGCGGAARGAGRGTVVASFYPLAFAARQIEGPRGDVRNLTPAGAEPHDVELTPGDVAMLQRAGVVLYLSHGFQPAVEQALDGAHGRTIDLLRDLPLDGEAGKADPHVWLDPVLFARVVRHVGSALGRAARASALAGRVLALDRDYRTGLSHCARRVFVTSHAAFGYLAARYRLRQVPLTGIDPESEPSPKTLARLVRLVRREHVSTVFFERLVSPRLAETVAHEAGARAAVLDPIEGLTPAEQRAGKDYLALMRDNLVALREALGCR
jgi:zinc transport system substrate-binding protein